MDIKKFGALLVGVLLLAIVCSLRNCYKPATVVTTTTETVVEKKTTAPATATAPAPATTTTPAPASQQEVAEIVRLTSVINGLNAEMSAMKSAMAQMRAGVNPPPASPPPLAMPPPASPATAPQPAVRPITLADLRNNRIAQANRLVKKAEEIRSHAQDAEARYGAKDYTAQRTWELAHDAEAVANRTMAEATGQ